MRAAAPRCAATRIVHLRYTAFSKMRAARLTMQVETQLGELGIGKAPAPIFGGRPVEQRGIAARGDPRLAQRRQALTDVDARLGVGVGPRGVVDHDRRIAAALRDLAHRHAQRADVQLARIGQRLDRRFVDVRGGGEKLRIGVHGVFLRRDYPHQVRRVCLTGTHPGAGPPTQERRL